MNKLNKLILIYLISIVINIILLITSIRKLIKKSNKWEIYINKLALGLPGFILRAFYIYAYNLTPKMP